MSEHAEQCALVQWSQTARYRGRPLRRWLFAIPNGGDRNPIVAAKLKAEGVTPGVPDLCLRLALGGYHGLFIEMKAIGGRPTAEQLECVAELNADGYKAAFCYGADEARIEILRYIGRGPDRLIEREVAARIIGRGAG